MTDTEIVQFLNTQSKNSEVCGRFQSTQLSRPLWDTSIAPFRQNPLKWVASLLLVLSAKMSFAGLPSKNNVPKMEQSKKISSEFPPDTLPQKGNAERNVISGVVLSNYGEKLRNVNVYICDSNWYHATPTIWKKTDSNGHFTLNVPDILLTDEIYLSVVYEGFENKYLIIKKEDIPKPLMIELNHIIFIQGIKVYGKR